MISDALPIQFWVENEPVFNEQIVYEIGYENKKYFYKANSTDPLTFQAVGYNSWNLKVYSGDTLLETIPLVEVIDGVWQYTYIPTAHAIVNQKIRFVLVGENSAQFLNPNFVDHVGAVIDDWEQTDTDVEEWEWDNHGGLGGVYENARMNNDNGGVLDPLPVPGEFLKQDKEVLKGAKVTVSYNAWQVKYQGVSRFEIWGMKDDEAVDLLWSELMGIENDEGALLQEGLILTALNDYDQIGVRLAPYPTGTHQLFLDYLFLDSNIITYNSDCICVKPDHKNTRLVAYTNVKDFAGIVYTGLGANKPTFYRRLHSRFFKERTPQESESETLSDGSVEIGMASSKRQKRLEIEPCPPYEHYKNILVLQHNTVLIGNKNWVMDDNYSNKEINDRFPLESAEVWLTLKNNSYVSI